MDKGTHVSVKAFDPLPAPRRFTVIFYLNREESDSVLLDVTITNLAIEEMVLGWSRRFGFKANRGAELVAQIKSMRDQRK